MAATYVLEKEIMIQAPLPEVWRFFSNPANLVKITPGYMNFRIVRCPDTEDIYEGMEIEYRVSPLLHIPVKWITLIKEVRPLHCFTDTQHKGPYALWEHTHTFRETDQGTHMHDHVRYAMPLGPLGAMAHSLFVKKQLQAIFDYRKAVIGGLFAGAQASRR